MSSSAETPKKKPTKQSYLTPPPSKEKSKKQQQNMKQIKQSFNSPSMEELEESYPFVASKSFKAAPKRARSFMAQQQQSTPYDTESPNEGVDSFSEETKTSTRKSQVRPGSEFRFAKRRKTSALSNLADVAVPLGKAKDNKSK